MFGKKLSEYVRFESWVLILIVVVFLARLGLSLRGSSYEQIRWVSINVVLLVGWIYCAIAVHIRKFGAYKQLLGLLLVQNVFAHWLIALAIVLGIVTGTPNIFTVPEVSGGSDGATWFHVGAHVIGGVLVSFFAWAFGSLILLVTRRVQRAS
jgi:hypothetical protein